jgi:hypothetical protein
MYSFWTVYDLGIVATCASGLDATSAGRKIFFREKHEAAD